MPNHTLNVLYLEDKHDKESLKETIYKYLTFSNDEQTGQNETNLDFNKIIPMPEELSGIPARMGDNLDDKELAEKYKQNLEKYGFRHWYDWAIANWATKWNSYDGQLSDYSMSFLTAWSPPLPVIEKLAQLTGKVFILDYVDEGHSFIGKFIAGPEGAVDECYNFDEAPQHLLEAFGLDDNDSDEVYLPA